VIVIGLRDEFLAALYFMGELIPNGGDTSDTGNMGKLAFKGKRLSGQFWDWRPRLNGMPVVLGLLVFGAPSSNKRQIEMREHRRV
jgi:hypothetical protein